MSPPANHEATFQAWLEEHRGIFVKVARSFGRGENEVADLQQEMMFQLWLSVPRYAGQAKPSTWIYRVCLNTALTWRRGAQRQKRRLEPEADVSLLSAKGAW